MLPARRKERSKANMQLRSMIVQMRTCMGTRGADKSDTEAQQNSCPTYYGSQELILQVIAFAKIVCRVVSTFKRTLSRLRQRKRSTFLQWLRCRRVNSFQALICKFSAKMEAGTPAQVAPPASAARIPAAIPNAVTAEQQLDSMANSLYLYRPGELVWYNKNTGTWGLAIITMRQVKDNKARYLVQPLSHPYYHPNAQVKTQDDDLRPWLAWSVPALGNAKYQNSTYDQVPWNEILASYPADPIVDGSILAAKAIDSSYSFFEPDTSILTGPGEKAYKGMYVGEPVRLRGPGNDPVVLVIKKIIERTVSAITSSVAIIGDVYTLVQMPAPLQSRQVPQRMSKDLDFRNDVEGASQKGLWNEWRISEPSATKRLEDIKGRWYETRNLLPVLRGVAQFQADVAKGITGDAGLWMNGRGDFTTGNIKKRDRESTLGPSVPQGTKVSRGLDDPAGDRFPDLMEVDNGYMALH
jgi:hypothetical protein